MANNISLKWIEENMESYLLDTYKYLHQNPELSTQEQETQVFIKKELDRLNISYKVMAQTGLCAEIHGAEPGKTILLRADIDALPIHEQTSLDYSSKKAGVMHACGHDAHMTVGLGVAALLKERTSEWKGTVKIMFQPSEEVHPGGAKPMIEEGILENPKVDAAICLHTNPFLAPGKFELKNGYMLANSDDVHITLIGKGGHAAAPQQGIDAVAMAGQFLTGVQNIVSRQTSPLDHAVITFGKINGGTKSNVICDQVEIAGTVRTIKKETQEKIQAQLEALVQSVASFWGGSYSFKFEKGYPAAWNDQRVTDIARSALKSSLGNESVVEIEYPYMSGDDFAYVAQSVPSVFMYWGTGSQDQDNYPWHHPRYHVNLSALKYGVTAATQCLLNLLQTEEVGKK